MNHTTEQDERQLQSYFESIERAKRIVPGQSLSPHLISFLDLSRSQLTDSGLQFICSLVHVKHLVLSQCSRITNNGIGHTTALTSLVSLDISKCRLLTNLVAPFLTPLLSLKKLSLASLNVDDSIADYLPLHISELDLSRTSVSGLIIHSLAQRSISASLSVLVLSNTNISSYQDLIQLSCFPLLKRVDLDGTQVVFNGSIIKLKGGNVAHVTRGSSIDINDAGVARKKETPSWYPTPKEKDICASWAHVNTPPKPKRILDQRYEFFELTFTPSPSTNSNQPQKESKRRRLTFDKENTPTKKAPFDSLFPAAQEVLQSLQGTPFQEDNINFLLSPVKRSIPQSHNTTSTLGENSPLPNVLVDLLKLPQTSPNIVRTKSKLTFGEHL